MRASLIAVSALSTFAILSVAHAEELSADRCQPLTESNRTLCCSASNWKDIILPGEQLSCSRSDTQQNQLQQAPEDTTGSITTPIDDGDGTTGGGVTPGGDGTSGDQPGAANPGNSNDVGGSGEKGMDGENPSTGTKGNSN